MTFAYCAYGLRFESDIKLPFQEGDAGQPRDVRIAEGCVEMGHLKGMQFRNWESEPGKFCIHLANVATAMTTGGNEIRYAGEPGADIKEIVSLVIGSAMAALLMQRDILPLHSCSVDTDAGALVVVGQSGAGKSTLLGGLREHGLSMMADDVTGITLDDQGRAMAIPSFPSSRLWQDSLNYLGEPTEGLALVQKGASKYYLPVDDFIDTPRPVRAVAWLSPSNRDDLAIEPVAQSERLHSLSHFIFRKRFLVGLEKRALGFQNVAAILKNAPLIRVYRPSQAIDPKQMAGRILDAL